MSAGRPALLSVWAALVLAGCTGKLHLGAEPPVWQADHETGDLSQWIDADPDAGVAIVSGGTLTVQTEQAHGGSSAVLATIAATDRLSSAWLHRGGVPQDAHLSAWFYLPRPYTIVGYWDLFELQSLAYPGIDATKATLWSVDLRAGEGSDMTFYLWDSTRAVDHHPDVPLVAPVGRWFRIEAFVHQATDESGHIAVWIDGSKLAEVSGIATVPTPWLGWSIGSSSNAIAEAPVELYLDDAMIVARRN